MSFVQKIQQMIGKNAHKITPAVDRAGDMIDKKTGGKYRQQVGTAQQKAKQAAEQMRRKS